MLDFLWQAKMPMRNSDPRRCLKSATSLLASLLLSGCISASPRAMYELSKFDPFTADPRGIAVAVQTDRNLRLRTGDVILQVALDSPDKAYTFDETFLLALTEGATDPRFTAKVERNDHIIVAAFAEADIARYEWAQSRARAAKAAGKSASKGSLTVGVRGGCRADGPLDDGTRIRTYMRTGSESGYFPLTGDMALKAMLGAGTLAGIPPCA